MNQPSPDNLPIYQDPVTFLYYYPIKSLTKTHDTKQAKREIQPHKLSIECEPNLFYDINTGAFYTALKTSTEWEEVREKYQRWDTHLVFYDTKEKSFIHPKFRMEDQKPKELIIVGKHPLYLDPKTKLLMNIENGVYYESKKWWMEVLGYKLGLKSILTYNRLKGGYGDTFVGIKVEPPDCYYDPNTEMFFHPIAGYFESRLRRVLFGTPPLVFMDKLGKYFNRDRKLFYYESKSPDNWDFKELEEVVGEKREERGSEASMCSQLSVEEEEEVWDRKESHMFMMDAAELFDPVGVIFSPKPAPIYFDGNEYYYPESFLNKDLDANSTILKEVPRFFKDPEHELYFDPELQTQYFKVKNLFELRAYQNLDQIAYFDPRVHILFQPVTDLNPQLPPKVMVRSEKISYDLFSKRFLDEDANEFYPLKVPPTPIRRQKVDEKFQGISEEAWEKHLQQMKAYVKTLKPQPQTEPNRIVPEIETEVYRLGTTKKVETSPTKEYAKAYLLKKRELETALREKDEHKYKWGKEVEDWVEPPQKRRMTALGYYGVKSEKEKLSMKIVRKIPMYSNPKNLINDTLVPYALYLTNAITNTMFKRVRYIPDDAV